MKADRLALARTIAAKTFLDAGELVDAKVLLGELLAAYDVKAAAIVGAYEFALDVSHKNFVATQALARVTRERDEARTANHAACDACILALESRVEEAVKDLREAQFCLSSVRTQRRKWRDEARQLRARLGEEDVPVDVDELVEDLAADAKSNDAK